MNELKLFESKKTPSITMNYYIALPEDYDTSDKKYPLILFLHGAGERGTNAPVTKVHGVPKLIDRGEKIDAVCITPQCPSELVWDNIVMELKELLDGIIAEYRIDTENVNCTGLSMGGFGTWTMGVTYSTFFHKIAPVCGGGMAWRAAALKDVPIKAYHGGADGVVNPERSKEMVNAVIAQGGSAELTIYEGVGHDSWVNAYEKSDLVEWLITK